MGRRRLVILTRYPDPGKVKTRLIPALGPEKAAFLHKQMTEHTLKWAASLAKKSSGLLEIRFDGGNRDLLAKWLGSEWDYTHQGAGDLGDRMARAFQENFQIGKKEVVVVGTDCPQMTIFQVGIAFDDGAIGFKSSLDCALDVVPEAELPLLEERRPFQPGFDQIEQRRLRFRIDNSRLVVLIESFGVSGSLEKKSILHPHPQFVLYKPELGRLES